MADNPFGGAAEGIQQGQNQMIQAFAYKRQVLQQKYERIQQGFKDNLEILKDPNVPKSLKNTIINSPTFNKQFTLLTGGQLPAGGINWSEDHDKVAAKLSNLFNNKVLMKSPADFRQAVLQTVAEAPPGQQADFAPQVEYAKQLTGGEYRTVDVGGKTVTMDVNPATGEQGIVNVPGMGQAVSTSQKAITQQDQLMKQHEAQRTSLLASLGKIQQYKSGIMDRIWTPDKVKQAVGQEQTAAKQSMMEMGFNKDEIENSIKSGEMDPAALERVSKPFMVPGTPTPPPSATVPVPSRFLKAPPAPTPTPAPAATPAAVDVAGTDAE